MDEKLKAKLDATGLKYTEDNDGDGKFLFRLDEERTQAVWVDGKKDQMGDYEDWDIFSVVAKMEEDNFPGSVATGLLRENGGFKAGGFMIRNNILMFKLEVSCDISPAGFGSAITMVAKVADQFEKKMTDGGDAF